MHRDFDRVFIGLRSRRGRFGVNGSAGGLADVSEKNCKTFMTKYQTSFEK